MLPKSCTFSGSSLNADPSFASGCTSEGVLDGSKAFVKSLEPRIRWTDRFLIHSCLPAWERLINNHHATEEGISLIADIFSHPSEAEVVKDLRGDNAQSFINVVDEVPPILLPWKN